MPQAAWLVLLSVILGAVFSGAKAALLSLEPEELRRMAQAGIGWARRVASMLDPATGVSGTAAIGVELSFLGGLVVVFWWGPSEPWYLALWVGGYLGGFLWMGELLPQELASARAGAWAPGLSWVLVMGKLLLWPWVRLTAALEPVGVGLSTKTKRELDHSAARQELSWRLRAPEGSDQGLQEERRMIDRILRFSKGSAREVMIPLIEVCALEERASVREAIRIICQEGYSRLPVYRERVDRMLGIVRGMDLLEVNEPDAPVSAYVRPVPLVPETMPLAELLVKLQREGEHMAMVVDEYGGVVGIITMEDLLEEIVGDIQDEYDLEEPEIRWMAPNQVLVSARVEIDSLNERLGLDLPKEDYETLGGLLLKAFRRIPGRGDSLVLGGVSFTVQKATDRSVEEVCITLPRPQGGGSA